MAIRWALFVAEIVCGLSCWSGLGTTSAAEAEMRKPVSFSGRHAIRKNDFGRPVVLIASALGVKSEVFRKAFRGVRPARGRGPTGAEARRNKDALMRVLAPHKVTNERLDEVSDYYRYRPQVDELWPTTAAEAYAVVVDGQIQMLVVTKPGSGYCSEPTVSVAGFEDVDFEVTLKFGKKLETNGRVKSIEVVPAKASNRR